MFSSALFKTFAKVLYYFQIKRKEGKTKDSKFKKGAWSTGSLGNFLGLVTITAVLLLSKFSSLLATRVPVSWGKNTGTFSLRSWQVMNDS